MRVKCVQNFDQEIRKKGPFERPRHRWESNIELDLKEIGYEGVDWMLLALDRFSGELL
jgi:hypothetical protein